MTEPHVWGPQPALFAAGGLLTAVAAVWVLVAGSTVDQVVAGFIAVVAAVGTAAGLMMRQRLRASPHGLVVAGPTGRTLVAWSQVTRIEVVSRSRMGIASTALEIDLDDDGLLIFGKTDLGTDPAEVARVLRGVKNESR